MYAPTRTLAARVSFPQFRGGLRERLPKGRGEVVVRGAETEVGREEAAARPCLLLIHFLIFFRPLALGHRVRVSPARLCGIRHQGLYTVYSTLIL